MKRSESQCHAILESGRHDELSSYEAYRAHVPLANNGITGELLSRGRFGEASAAAECAIVSFSGDGCSEDLSVSRYIAVLARLAAGDLESARKQHEQIHIRGGKLTVYDEAYERLLAGKVPNPPKGHPLEGTPWPRFAVKKESIPAKILCRLQAGPATPDNLIAAVWGENAAHPSYRNRLFVAINKLKKNTHQTLVFDGTSYRLE